MATVTIPAPVVADAPYTGPVVAAQDLTRRYGEGETAVDALRGVSLEVAAASSSPSWARRAPASRR